MEHMFLQSKSPAYRQALEECRRVAASRANILLIGESGAGKDVAAQYIHACSKRSKAPLIAINCNAYTETLLEAELFGHEAGAFTGAVRSRAGKFESAHGGTLFLDEIGELDLSTQVKLLRAIETKEIERIGGNAKKRIDFRLITATNQDLMAKVRDHSFREDFFYRISTIVIRIPPLRERREDLIDMIHFFLEESQRANEIRIDSIEDAAWDFLCNYEYPGNIRELKNTIDRMVVLSRDHIIGTEGIPILYNIHLQPPQAAKAGLQFEAVQPWRKFKAETEKAYLQYVLRQMGWNMTATAQKLELSTRQLFNKMREYGISRD